MAKDALIKLRCSVELKDRLLVQAKKRDQSLADYIRTRLVDELMVEEEHAPYGVTAPRQKKAKAG